MNDDRLRMLEYFSATKKYDLKVYEISEDNINTLSDILPPLFLKCYASKKKISKASKNGVARREVIASYIPDKPNIMSGEFGEILSFHIMKDEYSKLNPYAPLKWRYKEAKNSPSPKTDFILICHDVNNDLVVAAECKTKATPRTKNPIEEAINGMRKDMLTRLTSTLIWLRDKAIQAGKTEKIKILNKLLDPVIYGGFEKEFKAIAIIDKDLFTEPLHTEDDISDLKFNFELIAIVVPQLKKNYKTIFEKMLEC